MSPKDFWRNLGSDPKRAQFAEACGTTFHHLRNCIFEAGKVANPQTCVRIEAESRRAVMRWDLRPADWHLIWPELIGRKGAPAVSASVA